MQGSSNHENQIQYVTSFHDLVSVHFHWNINAICWSRKLTGNFLEIVEKIELTGNITEVGRDELLQLQLTEQGQLAREVVLSDFDLLKAHGASPVLNVITEYDKDETYPFFPTDVYSFHADRSPIPTSTFLCTYVGAPSEILPNAQAVKKIVIPEIRNELKKLHHGTGEDFESFLADNFFDLHYQALPGAVPVSLGQGNLWRLAVDHPQSPVLPCIHRAPKEKPGEKRLLMIC